MKCFVFDLDGTLANCEHRLHHINTHGKKPDWRAFFAACEDDEEIEPIVTLYRALRNGNYCRVILSGRSDECREQTEKWLWKVAGITCDALYMRKTSDFRPDDVVKSEILDQMLADGWEPILFVDDRKRVVDMWRDRGFMCLQCAPGDF